MEEILLKYGSEERSFATPIGNVTIKSGLHGLLFREKSFDFFNSEAVICRVKRSLRPAESAKITRKGMILVIAFTFSIKSAQVSSSS
jgi:hypothetical protein